MAPEPVVAGQDATLPDPAVRDGATNFALRPEWLLPVAGAVLLLILLLALLGRRREPARLTPEGREEVLARVQAWLRRDGALREDGRQA